MQKALRKQILFHLEAASSYAEQLEWSRGREMIDNLKHAIERSDKDQSVRSSESDAGASAVEINTEPAQTTQAPADLAGPRNGFA
jgi:hypothetical protein